MKIIEMSIVGFINTTIFINKCKKGDIQYENTKKEANGRCEDD